MWSCCILQSLLSWFFRISLLYQWHSLTFNNFFSFTFSHFEILTRKLHTSLFLSHIVILRLHINSVGDFIAENGFVLVTVWHDWHVAVSLVEILHISFFKGLKIFWLWYCSFTMTIIWCRHDYSNFIYLCIHICDRMKQ